MELHVFESISRKSTPGEKKNKKEREAETTKECLTLLGGFFALSFSRLACSRVVCVPLTGK